jgi:hypothetical protein
MSHHRQHHRIKKKTLGARRLFPLLRRALTSGLFCDPIGVLTDGKHLVERLSLTPLHQPSLIKEQIEDETVDEGAVY